jgi:hypothetical protein
LAAQLSLAELLGPDDRAALGALGQVEVLVGIPALNHARSVRTVLDAVAAGLAAALPAQKTAVVIADDGSQDDTLEVARAWREASPALALACVRVAGLPRRGRASLGLLAAARDLGARACLLVDANLTSFDPRGVGALVDPVLRDDVAYVFPAYTRTVVEGTLTSNLLAPLAGALYGRRVQQLLGGCAGISGPLVERVLGSSLVLGAGSSELVNLHLAVEALVADTPVVETHLGVKRADPGPIATDLPTTVVRSVGPFFELMEHHAAEWQTIRPAAPVPQQGGSAPLLPAAQEAHPERMVRTFRTGLKDLLPVWEQIMPEETLERLYPLGLLAPDEFRFPATDWARVVADFAVAHHERRVPRDHLLRALTPLYLGRVAAFLQEARGVAPTRLPKLLDALADAFTAERARLADRWR